MWLHRLDDADASCGGKALGLARLIAAGLPVPEGFVLDHRAFRHVIGDLDPANDAIGHALLETWEQLKTAELPPELVREVDARAAGLGLLAVRSSATMEDGEAGAAAGVFSSRAAVPASEVWDAIRFVWRSALTPLAVAYARRRGAPIAIGVIIQRFVPGELVTIYTRPPGAPTGNEVVLQRGTSIERIARSSAASGSAALALQAEVAISADGGADVEIIEEPTARWVVQARPIVHRVIPTRRPPPPHVIAPLVADGRRWTWDVAHNPDPLSPAQAGLVERVDRAEIAPWSLRVCAGFLYAARREDAKSHEVVAPTTISGLDARVTELEVAMQSALEGTSARRAGATIPAPSPPTRSPTTAAPPARTLSTTADDDHPSLAIAIERYLAFYAIWATELAPLIAAARANLSPALLAGARPSSVESTLLAAARGELDEQTVLDRIGLMSPAWDVSVPTFAERPTIVRAAIDRARAILAAPSPNTAATTTAATTTAATTPATTTAATDTLHHHARVVANETERARAAQLIAAVPERVEHDGELLHQHARSVAEHAERDLARAAADLAERDDVWFARAQWLVRAAILERARELAIDPEDAFWIPLEQLATATALDADDVRRRASGARAAGTRVTQWAMPIVVGGVEEQLPSGGELRGIGTGPRITGRVVRFETLASVIVVTAGDIVVTRAVTPALAVLVIGCAALVSETGGLLDHGAALARELGIPCVVGCLDAWQLTDGMVVTVDGDAGTVEVRAK